MNLKKVILVEDDDDDRDLFLAFLAQYKGVQLLRPVGNGQELITFLDQLASDESLPSLIVLDQNMPIMTGKQTLAFLLQHDRYANIPAVIYSTYTDHNLIADCEKLGAKMVASKPIDEEGYKKMMDDFMKLFSD